MANETTKLEAMVSDAYGFSESESYTRADNPFWDATDAAHPAWWRGNDAGAVSTAIALREIIESKEHRGTFGGVELERAAQAVLSLITDNESMLQQLAAAKRDGIREGMEMAARIASNAIYSGDYYSRTTDAQDEVARHIAAAIRAKANEVGQ